MKLMTKVLISMFVAAFLMTTLVACNDKNGTNQAPATPSNHKVTSTEDSYAYDDYDNTGGIGYTYSGKVGIDMGGGLVMPLDGSGMGFGF